MDDAFPDLNLHNVAELTRPVWTDAGWQLERAPAAVRDAINETAGNRLSHPSGSELRTVPLDDEVEITLSAHGEVPIRIFWGPFQVRREDGLVHIGPEPTTITLSKPAELERMAASAAESAAIDPNVCRIRFELTVPVAVHDVIGDCRNPRPGELPEERHMAYGTSITAGAAATHSHLSYLSRVSRRLGVDPINLGTSGAAHCDPAIADYIAGRDDWDFATLEVSVNMTDHSFSHAEFDERVRNMIDTVAGENPDRPVFAVSLFPYREDLYRDGDPEWAAGFRSAVREAVAEGPANVHLVEGEDLLDPIGLSADLLHPGDAGMEQIADGLAEAITDVWE